MRALSVLVALLLLVLFVVAALALRAGPAGARLGGAAREPARRRARPSQSPHLVVDTLNLTHWRQPGGREAHRALTPEAIVETIDRTAPALKARHADRVVYVLKDQESRFNDEAARQRYHEAARRNGVYVAMAERYEDPPRSEAGSKAKRGRDPEHAAKGRDDFYMALLAHRLRCAVLTEDRFRDFARLRAAVPPFHTLTYAYWGDRPEREYIRPADRAYARVARPPTVRPSALFAQKIGDSGAGALEALPSVS